MDPKTNPLHSCHIFLFPFQWNALPGPGFEARTDLQKIRSRFGNSLAGHAGLVWKPYQFDWRRDYNEALYFYRHIREVLFAKQRAKNTAGLQYHVSCEGMNLEYRISLNAENHSRVLQLEIEELTLNFYDTGIGLLGFHLNNRHYGKPEDILLINDFGRRIFPQFLGDAKENPLEAPKNSFLADRIEIYQGDKLLCEQCGDDFSGVAQKLLTQTDPEHHGFLIPGFIWQLLPACIVENNPTAPSGSIAIEPLLDDRMFVICWVGNKTWSQRIKPTEGEFPHLTDKRWHQLIFVDGKSPGLANKTILRQLNEAHTYTRWLEYGTLYGLSRYSLVVLTDGMEFSRNMVLRHVQTVYFQIALLCLLQRGSIVRFSDEIARLVGYDKVKLNYPDTKEAQALNEKYLYFINRIYFREVTPQEQGIELYNLFQEKMEIDRDVKNLQTEIQDFFNLLKLQADERHTEALGLLTVMGSALLVPGLILAYFGISEFTEIHCKPEMLAWVAWLCLAGGTTAFLTARARTRNRPHWRLFAMLTLVILACSAYLPFWFADRCPAEQEKKQNTEMLQPDSSITKNPVTQ